jgi:hypothetical protein
VVMIVVGVVLLALGLFAGGALVLVPLGLAPWSTGPALWVLFPLFSLGGYLMLATGAHTGTLRTPSLLLSSLLLLLSLAAAAGLVLEAASLVRAVAPTHSLWYVMVVAGLLGSLGAAAYGRRSDAA